MRKILSNKRLAGLFAGILFSTGAAAGGPVTYTDHARVVHVEPRYRTELIREPQRVCNFVPHRPHRGHTDHRHGYRHDSGATIVGGVIGGAIGHHLTRTVNGRANAGATLAGAVIGATVANARHSQRHRPGRYHDDDRHSGRRHCTTTTVTREHRVPDGYQVTYVYRGNRFETRTRRHPGKRIPVTITISAGSH